MEHIQALERSSGPDGERDMSGKNIIRSIKVASDMSEYALMPLQVMKTDTESFRDFINSRINRRGEWFIYQADYMDACGLPMPVRLAPNQPD
jgi:peptidylprolyl isomerase